VFQQIPVKDARVRTVAYDAGYQSVYWTVDALDWKEVSGETNESVTRRILSHVSPGTIYLMHIGDTITGDILDAVFTEIESRGYMIVPLTKGI
jgi:peptidoglycan/xylan/chitin deacetylase (PgdA/CDA1 family)